MEKLDKKIEHIKDEICDAVEYAENYVGEKMKNNMNKAAKFKEMALNEQSHAQNWYNWTEEYAEELEKIMPLTSDDVEAWEKCKKLYADKTAIIRYMLDR